MPKVKVIQNHYGPSGMVFIGDEYEATEANAAILKRNGLVEWGGKPAEPEKTEKIFVSDKKKDKK